MADRIARRRKHRPWVTFALLAALIAAYFVTIRFVMPWLITGRF